MAIQRHISFGGHSVLEQMVFLERGIASLLVMVNRYTVCMMVKVKHLSYRMCHIIYLVPYLRTSILSTHYLICMKYFFGDLQCACTIVILWCCTVRFINKHP